MRIMTLVLAMMLLPVTFVATAHGGMSDPNVARYFEVKLDIQKDGRSIGTPSAIVERGKTASITQEEGPDGRGLRLDFTIDPVITETGLATAVTRMMVYESRAGAWQLLGEPTIQTLIDGRTGSLEIDAGKAKLGVTVAVTIMTDDALRARFAGEIPQATECADAAGTIAGGSLLGGVIASGNCCTGFCRPPPGQMTCCGAVACCACGVCCQVP